MTGFEGLKNSGLKGKLRNSAIDSLLNTYYFSIEKIADRETRHNNFIESMEKEFLTQHSSIKYNQLLSSYSDSLVIINPEQYLELEQSLQPYFQSNSFQSALFRTSSQSNNRLINLIETGNILVESINDYINVSNI